MRGEPAPDWLADQVVSNIPLIRAAAPPTFSPGGEKDALCP
jgi:hypothetical protein